MLSDDDVIFTNHQSSLSVLSEPAVDGIGLYNYYCNPLMYAMYFTLSTLHTTFIHKICNVVWISFFFGYEYYRISQMIVEYLNWKHKVFVNEK